MLGKKGPNVKHRQELGKKGEDLAIQYLIGEGFKLIERNFRTRFGEIDIVATKGKEYFFIEVKTREGEEYGTAIESLPFYRRERLKKMALFYVMRKRLIDQRLHLSLLGIDDFEIDPKITFIKDIVGEL